MMARQDHTLAALAALIVLPAVAQAQTDYYNTDRGRPLRTEDAYPLERRAFELQAAPVRLERGGGVSRWTIEPELAYGILPRTQVELGVPMSFIEGDAASSGQPGLELGLMHNLNAETAIPALAIGVGVALPDGFVTSDAPLVSFSGIATRTFPFARFHVNGEYTIGDAPTSASSREATRWSAGLAMDRTFPLRSLLVGAELVVERSLFVGEDPTFLAGTGVRYQLAPRWAIDGGVGRTLRGDERAWYVTLGTAYAFGLPWRKP
jgi:hypothetical protein